MPTDDLKKVCCAAGVCCPPGSAAQLDALTSLLEEADRVSPERFTARHYAAEVLRLFKLSDRDGRSSPEDFAA